MMDDRFKIKIYYLLSMLGSSGSVSCWIELHDHIVCFLLIYSFTMHQTITFSSKVSASRNVIISHEQQ